MKKRKQKACSEKLCVTPAEALRKISFFIIEQIKFARIEKKACSEKLRVTPAEALRKISFFIIEQIKLARIE